MSDVHDKKTRSYNMSRIRSKDTKPEILVRKYLFSKGFRYRIHDKKLPGKPDLVFPKYKTAVFVHGCFWHGHKRCSKSTLPKSNRAFWERKIKENLVRDTKSRKALKLLGWKVAVIWQCEIKKSGYTKLVNKIIS